MFREHAARTGERVYYATDIHWNDIGNRVAAEATASALASIVK